MVTSRWIAAAWMEVGLILLMPGCGGGGRGTNVTTAPTTYVLTVNSATPASGVPITVAPADNNGAANGTTGFTRTYTAGATVTLTAPATAGANIFTSWSGCATASTATCTVTLSSNTSVTAAYAAPATHVLTVSSTNPASGVAITASMADNSNVTAGSTSLTLTYDTGTTVTLTASSTSGSNGFASWTGCTIPTNTLSCQVTLNRDLTVTANYGGTVTGKVYYVSGAGNDNADGLSTTTPFLTLQHAANLTQPGDTVYAMNGMFTNSTPSGDVLDISTPGTPGNWIAYKAYPGQTPMLSFNGWEGVFIEPSAAYIEVNGFTIVGNNGNVTLAGAQAQSTTNPDPAYNGNCIAADGRQGTATQRPHHLKILNNVISECGGGGIGTLQVDYLTISGNTIYNTSWYAIYGTSGISTLGDWNSDNSTATKVFITGNRLYGNQEFIPWVNAGVITDGEAIIIDSLNNDYAGSPLSAYVGRTYIANNVIYGNGSAAIEVFDSAHVDVVNNSTYKNVLSPAESGRGEMNLNRAADVNVINNIFYSSSGQNPVTSYTACDSCVLKYNLYYNGTNSPASLSGANDLIADPLYVDPAAQDLLTLNLNVGPASPAVGSGTSDLAPSVDFNGNPRPSGAGIDRGAYQRPAAPATGELRHGSGR